MTKYVLKESAVEQPVLVDLSTWKGQPALRVSRAGGESQLIGMITESGALDLFALGETAAAALGIRLDNRRRIKLVNADTF